MDARTHHEGRRAALGAEKAAEEKKSLTVSSLRVLSFVGAVGCAGSGFFAGLGWALGAAAGVSAVFVGLVVWHARIARREERLGRALAFHERALLRLDGKLAELPARDGPEDAPPYARDLDLFGARSLLSVLDALGAAGGRAVVAKLLVDPPPPSELAARRAAIVAMAARPDLVERLAMERFDAGPAPEMGGGATRPPRVPFAIAAALPLVTLGAYAAAKLGHAPSSVWQGLLLVHAVVAWLAQGDVVGLLGAQAEITRYSRFADFVRDVRGERTGDETLDRLLGDLARAGDAYASLLRIVSWVEVRSSMPLGLVVAWLGLVDPWLAFFHRRWIARHGAAVQAARASTDELEAYACLGAYAFENPTSTYADVHEGAPELVAEGLAHPLLPASRRVANDVQLAGPGKLLFVTGSNMSGKSTLLRALGLAVVMARAGIPVAAKKLVVTPMRLGTSLRVSDSVADGVSHFYAELLALKRVVALADEGPTLFLLDEILHGTNSEERHAGAKAVVLHLLDRGAMGVLTTHDLALVDLVELHKERVVPVHLMELAKGEELAFDYLLRPGVLRSGNALKLMRTLGLPT